ncbi:glycoside hydrolase family 3 protein [Candidatus Marinarcus aquaticus]|uniref:Glycosyl hydrolase n=1 Tax=Candidatus Marinarcus aquaticus TaxID=2044504 RepID=A0A4Q0XRI3_9BACT|nr:glycoside hydrolase family 3 N-terminal domain-containing protein [Candidatus Marinarcus aquaticus]RXJ60010.1 glycosyl hydrolase [Candidatus Marinarcus aquaticus]
MLYRLFFALIFPFMILHAQPPSEMRIKKEIAHMLIIGFDEKKLSSQSQFIQQIKQYELGGVILFDRFYDDATRTKNIASFEQLKALTTQLKSANANILISVDQEGGRVERLKVKQGFKHTPSAQTISSLPDSEAKKAYDTLALQLRESGVNTNFAPVLDLALNLNNKVIYQLQRSYSKEPSQVVQYASVFMDALREQNIISVLKHFPGHGSSSEDSHKGFVDVSDTWSSKELEPYRQLIKQKQVPMIMIAHVFNQKWDTHYPATLSYNVNTKLLREQLGFKGVIVSDDMQMNAIRAHYSLEQSVVLAINSGVDILLFGNQLAYDSLESIINTIYKAYEKGLITYERIHTANQRIDLLKRRFLR